MQRKYQFLWLALIPFGAVGALATGFVSLPWQQSDDSRKVTASGKSAPTTALSESKPQVGKFTALEQQARQASQPLTKASEKSGDPILSTKKPRKFGIDIARISPNGSSVIAGYAKPGKPITIMADGKPIGVVTPDQSGDWVLITPHKFATLDPQITLQAGDHTARTVAALATRSSTSVSVAQQPVASKPTASQVTQRMLRRLKKLTEEASAQPAKQAGANTASAVVGDAPKKQRLALATAPSRLGGPLADSAAKQGATPTQPGALKTARSKQRVFAAAPKPVLPTALKAGKAGSAANVQQVALPDSIPVPVQFVFRRAVFTDQGRQAATLLLKYFKARKFSSVELSGHADERGSPTANKKLSRQRLASIRKFLRDGGFKGRLKLVAKGETEKFTGVDRAKFSREELYQLDRRVEVMSAR